MYESLSYSSAASENPAVLLLASLLPLVLALGLYLLYTIAWCKLFKKAGLPWERVFVPFYGMYWQYKVVRCQVIFWFTMVSLVLFYGGAFAVTIASAAGAASDTLLVVFGLLALIWMIAMLVMYCIYCSRMARAYGKGTGFTLGLIFLFAIFFPILAYGNAKYQLHSDGSR